ncbi:hypothetical protein EDD16DRAFT_1160323 [Pisolithus croceorrhizus]|nr:hypothetical protein EDD16DRAFT_1160323 [Pisolithus croceorrhizus]KAI6117799.1 hypothetical protein EV401DRAFT_1561459 [Pisolithus croceorrhizus]
MMRSRNLYPIPRTWLGLLFLPRIRFAAYAMLSHPSGELEFNQGRSTTLKSHLDGHAASIRRRIQYAPISNLSLLQALSLHSSSGCTGHQKIENTT